MATERPKQLRAMSGGASTLSSTPTASFTSTYEDTATSATPEHRPQMTVRIPADNHVAADEHEMFDDQLSSSDNEAFEEVVLLPPAIDEGENL